MLNEGKLKVGDELWILNDKASDIVERIVKSEILIAEPPFYAMEGQKTLCGLGQLFKTRNDAINELIYRLSELIAR